MQVLLLIRGQKQVRLCLYSGSAPARELKSPPPFFLSITFGFSRIYSQGAGGTKVHVYLPYGSRGQKRYSLVASCQFCKVVSL